MSTPRVDVEARRGRDGVEVVITIRSTDQTYEFVTSLLGAERLRHELESAIDSGTRILRGR